MNKLRTIRAALALLEATFGAILCAAPFVPTTYRGHWPTWITIAVPFFGAVLLVAAVRAFPRRNERRDRFPRIFISYHPHD